jgi:integrase
MPNSSPNVGQLRPRHQRLSELGSQGGRSGGGGAAQTPKLPKRLLDVLSREEVDRLEAATSTERDKLIIRVLADTGIRVTGLTTLRPTDLIERDRRRTCGSSERVISSGMYPSCRSWADAYAATSTAVGRGALRPLASSSAFAGVVTAITNPD